MKLLQYQIIELMKHKLEIILEDRQEVLQEMHKRHEKIESNNEPTFEEIGHVKYS
jgi:hypothetical protein